MTEVKQPRQAKIVLIGVPEHTMNILAAIARKTGKSSTDELSAALDARAKAVLGPNYLREISAK